MTFLRKLFLLGHRKIKINYVEVPDPNIIIGDKVFSELGVWLPDVGEVFINKSVPEADQKTTLIHEMIHAIDSYFKIDLKEKQVELLANGLHMFLEQNKLLNE